MVSCEPSLCCAVVGLGQCSLDFLGTVEAYPAVNDKAQLLETLIQGGGPVATALVTLARLGVATAFLGRVGDDDHGVRIRRELAGEGVDCRGLLTAPGASSQYAFIAVERKSGHRNIFWTRGTARQLAAAEVDARLIRCCRVLHLDGLQAEASIEAAMIARRAGVTTVLDGGTLRERSIELLPWIDHLVVSERFAREFVRSPFAADALEPLLQYGAEAVTVTCGEGGSHTLMQTGERFCRPAFKVDVVDTTGCGDVFHGGYIYGLLQGWPLQRVVTFAAACAALKTRRLGGRTAIASLGEVEKFMARNA